MTAQMRLIGPFMIAHRALWPVHQSQALLHQRSLLKRAQQLWISLEPLDLSHKRGGFHRRVCLQIGDHIRQIDQLGQGSCLVQRLYTRRLGQPLVQHSLSVELRMFR